MTHIDSWQCDVCKKVFSSYENDPLYQNPGNAYIKLDTVNQSLPSILYNFEDVCMDCRKKIVDALESVI